MQPDLQGKDIFVDLPRKSYCRSLVDFCSRDDVLAPKDLLSVVRDNKLIMLECA